MRRVYQHRIRYPEQEGFKFRQESGKVKERAAKKQRTTEKHEATAASGDGMLKNAPEVLEKSDKAQEPIITKPDLQKCKEERSRSRLFSSPSEGYRFHMYPSARH